MERGNNPIHISNYLPKYIFHQRIFLIELDKLFLVNYLNLYAPVYYLCDGYYTPRISI